MISKQKIYGLIGYPVKHSFSAAMHNAAFSHLGMDKECKYTLFEIKPDDLESFLLERTDLAGFNITIPHKVKAKEILEDNFENASATPDFATLVGAVNTVGRNDDGSIWWSNTDAPGFLKALDCDLGFKKAEQRDALVFGCGGAGRAVLSGLSWKGLVRNIFIYELSSENQQAVKDYYSNIPKVWDKLRFITKEEIAEKIKTCSLLVNTTPVGMKDDNVRLIDKKLLHADLSVYDVVYNRETQLIKDAKAKGLKAVGGLGMLLYQGALAFQRWTGVNGDQVVDIMRQALEGELEKCRI
ncbi:MAG: shikimate dehydrogenase [Candidatus Omnitrophica bacterium]|nr:shikimate dehydrogenase [Candidatus Omnitrophota bacterium]